MSNKDSIWFSDAYVNVINSRAPHSLVSGAEDKWAYQNMLRKYHTFIQNDVVETEYSVRMFSQGLELGEQGNYDYIQQKVFENIHQRHKEIESERESQFTQDKQPIL